MKVVLCSDRIYASDVMALWLLRQYACVVHADIEVITVTHKKPMEALRQFQKADYVFNALSFGLLDGKGIFCKIEDTADGEKNGYENLLALCDTLHDNVAEQEEPNFFKTRAFQAFKNLVIELSRSPEPSSFSEVKLIELNARYYSRPIRQEDYDQDFHKLSVIIDTILDSFIRRYVD